MDLPAAKEVSDLDKAYFAGLIDGEGCFASYVGKNGNISVKVCVVMSNREVLEYGASLFGGGLGKQRTTVGHKQCWSWNVSGSGCKTLLEAIIPFLRVKRMQAEVCLLLTKTIQPHGSRSVPEEIQLERIRLWVILSKLNNAGRVTEETIQ